MKFRFLLFLILFFWCSVAYGTTLTGTLNFPNSVGVNGRLYMKLSQVGAVSSAGSCGGPFVVVPTTNVIFTITNGAMPGGAVVVGTDCISPANTYYIVTFQDNQGNTLFTTNWTPTGTTVDVGTLANIATPTGTLTNVGPAGPAGPAGLPCVGTVIAYAGGTTYALNNCASSGGVVYISLQNANTGNTPASSPTFWASSAPVISAFGRTGAVAAATNDYNFNQLAGTATEAQVTLADNTTDNVTTSAHGFAPKAPNDATKFLNGASPPAYTVPATGVKVIANAASTGTTTNKLAKYTGAPSTVVLAATSDTTGIVGICTANCTTTGNATISFIGTTTCVFDGSTVAGHYVQISSSVAGDCHDTGAATFPIANGQVLGRVLTTNVGVGTYSLDLFSPEDQANNFPSIICSTTLALGTTTITSGSKTVLTVGCTGLATTDNIIATFNSDPTSTAGYIPSTTGILTLVAWPTANTINVDVINNTASSVTPGALTLNLMGLHRP